MIHFHHSHPAAFFTFSQRPLIESGPSLRSISSLSLCKFSITVITLAECFLSGWSVSQYRRVISYQNYCIFSLSYAELLCFFSSKEPLLAFIRDIIQLNQTLECCAFSEICVFQCRYIIIKFDGNNFIDRAACLLHLCLRNTKYFVI